MGNERERERWGAGAGAQRDGAGGDGGSVRGGGFVVGGESEGIGSRV